MLENKIKRITKNSLSEAIAEQIIGLISSGDLHPGERLPSERELCQQFGVGRSSLREALSCLAIVGVLDVRVGDGTFIAQDGQKFIGRVFEWRVLTEQQDLENLLEVRIALEADAAAYAATRGTEEQFQRLEKVLKEMQSSQNDPKKFAALDLDFHLIIAEASNNKLMHDLLTMIRGQLQQALTKIVSLPGGTRLACDTHKEIYDGVRKRDPQKARCHMKNAIQLALDRYRKAAAHPSFDSCSK
jgi:GntR family transcriptional repressor for pyruvate dehydrogenase complex